MNSRNFAKLGALAALTLLSVGAPASAQRHRSGFKIGYGQPPHSWQALQKPQERPVRWQGQSQDYAYWQKPGSILRLRHREGYRKVWNPLRIRLFGCNPHPYQVTPYSLPGVAYLGYSYPNESCVCYRSVYPGIDAIYYGGLGTGEYGFLVAPGADLSQIVLTFEGAQSLDLNTQGDLLLQTENGLIVHPRPMFYQRIGGVRQRIAGQYTLLGNGRVGFKVDGYDTTRPLLIDRRGG